MTVSALNSTRIEYPDEDGLPIAESDLQRDDLMNAVKGLGIYFQNRPDVYVSGNLFIYYEEGNPASVVSPFCGVWGGEAQAQVLQNVVRRRKSP